MSFKTNTTAVQAVADSRISSAVGSSVQAYNAKLANIAGATLSANTFIGSTDGSTLTALSASGARTALGLTSAATTSTVSSSAGATDSGKIPLLNSSGVLDGTFMPPIALVTIQTVANITARDALSNVQSGDVVVVTDAGSGAPKSYMYNGSAFVEIKTPAGSVDLSGATGTLTVGHGGTGATTLSGVLLGNGTSAFTAASTSTSGQFLKYNGSAYVFAGIDYSNVANTPSLATVATTGAYSDLTGKPSLATVATSGSYADLSNKPSIISTLAGLTDVTLTSISDKQVLKWDNASSKFVNVSLGTVAFTGSYTDLTDKPSFSTTFVALTDAPSSYSGQGGKAVRVNTGATGLEFFSLATVATSGSYADLSNKPSIPSAQVQTDWNASSGMGVLLNKPTLATVATSGSYTDLTNTPSIDGSMAKAVNVMTTSGDFTATNSHHVIIINKTTGEATAVNLPTVSTKKIFVIKDGKGDAATHNITIVPNGSEKIDGAANLVISIDFESVTIVSDGANWYVI